MFSIIVDLERASQAYFQATTSVLYFLNFAMLNRNALKHLFRFLLNLFSIEESQSI